MMRYAMLAGLAALGLSACVTDDVDNGDVIGPTAASAALRDSSGRRSRPKKPICRNYNFVL